LAHYVYGNGSLTLFIVAIVVSRAALNTRGRTMILATMPAKAKGQIGSLTASARGLGTFSAAGIIDVMIPTMAITAEFEKTKK